MTETPTAQTVEHFAPDLFALCDRVADASIAHNIDLDLESFDAAYAVMTGEPLETALGFIDPRHPAADEARGLLTALWGRHTTA